MEFMRRCHLSSPKSFPQTLQTDRTHTLVREPVATRDAGVWGRGHNDGDVDCFLHVGAGYHRGSECENSPTCALPGICLHRSFISIQIANPSSLRQMQVQVQACTHTLLPACAHPWASTCLQNPCRRVDPDGYRDPEDTIFSK